MDRQEGAVYISYGTRDAAEAACEEMNGETVDGGPLLVELQSQHGVDATPSQTSFSAASTGATTATEVKGQTNSVKRKLTSIPLSVDEQDKQESGRSDLPRRFSFKLSDNVDTGLSASVLAVNSAMIDVKNLPRLPSDSQSLFQPVRYGLDLSSAHSAMLSTLPVSPSGLPVPPVTHNAALQHHKAGDGKNTTTTTDSNRQSTTASETSTPSTSVSEKAETKSSLPCTAQTLREKKCAPTDGQLRVISKKADKVPSVCAPMSKLRQAATGPALRPTLPKPSLKQSQTQPIMLSQAAMLIDKASQDERVYVSPPPTIRHTQTARAAASVLKTTSPYPYPANATNIQRSKHLSKTAVSRASRSPPPITQQATKIAPTAPLSPSNREKSGSTSEEESSERNPFKEALARRPSPVKRADKPPSPQPADPKRKKAVVVSETIECSHLTSKRILFSKHRTQLRALQESHGVWLRGEEVDGTALSVTGETKSVQQVKSEVIALERSVQASISCETFTISCALLPCLADPDTVASLQSVEKQNAVDFAVPTVNCRMSLVECHQSLKDKLTETKGPLSLSQVQGFVERRPGYFWKVRHITTGEMVGFEDEVNEKINKAYTERELTCSFVYNSHAYVLDFSKMTLTDQTLEGQVHGLVKEPLWCRYVDDDFGYKPLRGGISDILESIFQQGAPGLIAIEGQQCVVDFDSTPMQAYSSAGESCVIQRQPELEPSNLVPVLTLRVRGLAENLAPAEKEFHQILQNKISTETLAIPLKIQDKVTRLLLVGIARQYCVQCVPDEDQSVLNISGTKEVVGEVHRLLLQETVRIMSVSDTPGDHALTPPNWEPQTSDVQLCPVTKDSPEWTHVEELMKQSLPGVRIEAVERIQNKHLWQKYSFFRRAMQRRMNGRDINEKELFHGTRSNAPSLIYDSDKGFDFRFGSSDCLWGQGSYFAVKASYSDRSYAYHLPSGKKQLILASVATGESKFMNKREKLSVPPLKPGSTKERYDTIKAVTGESEVYVVYDHEKAYPAYLISYRT